MIDDRELFERAVGRFAPPERSFERLVTRRDRKNRNKRITAAVLALVVAAAGAMALIRAFPMGSVPANPPEKPSVDLGIFAPVAGRIVYYEIGHAVLWRSIRARPRPARRWCASTFGERPPPTGSHRARSRSAGGVAEPSSCSCIRTPPVASKMGNLRSTATSSSSMRMGRRPR